jgi:hypothetical protein
LKYQKRLENNSTFRETKTIEIRIQKDIFREEYNKLADYIIGLNQQLIELFTANQRSSIKL